MTLAYYKKPITASSARHARGGFVDSWHCGMLYHEVTAALEEAAEEMAALDPEKLEERRAQLLKYCGLDTYAMVKVWRKLCEVAGPVSERG